MRLVRITCAEWVSLRRGALWLKIYTCNYYQLLTGDLKSQNIFTNWNVPNKIKCFGWLANHILTWQNLQTRGFQGLGICIMCRKGKHEINHMFMECLYAKAIWEVVMGYYNIVKKGSF